jgi:hypothetical protein
LTLAAAATLLTLPAQALIATPVGEPQAGIGARILWGGFGIDGMWAFGDSDRGLILGVKGSAGLLGSPFVQVGPMAGWRLPIDVGSALQLELGAGVLYGNSAIGGGTAVGPLLRGWSGIVEPAVRYMWQVSPAAWLGLFASCGVTVPVDGGPVMPLPAVGISITTMRPR